MNDVVVVQSFSTRTDADVAKSVLDANNIKSFVQGDDAGGMYPPTMGTIALLVNKKDKNRALQLLKK